MSRPRRKPADGEPETTRKRHLSETELYASIRFLPGGEPFTRERWREIVDERCDGPLTTEVPLQVDPVAAFQEIP